MRSYLSDGINHSSPTSCKADPGSEYLNFLLEMLSCQANKNTLDKVFNIVNKIDYIIRETFF